MTAKKADSYHLPLPESADILAVESLLEECKAAVAAGQPVTIDAGKTERLTTPVVQLLLVLEKKLQAASHTLTLEHPNDTVEQVFTTLGLSDTFNHWKGA